MNKKELDRFRKSLNGLAERLEHIVAAEQRELMRKDEPAFVASTGEAIDSGTLEIEEGLITNETALLSACRDALARIDAGTFGRCAQCGDTIARKRLESVPYARHCIDCAKVAQQVAS